MDVGKTGQSRFDRRNHTFGFGYSVFETALRYPSGGVCRYMCQVEYMYPGF